ncbi:DUF5681 domain-containing protein [Labrys okinawensis]|uniref:DUF5681 domain-containing protein n=1 Tax=Labrys okinawensis TaxID=346911 RepID=UPI0039BD48E6
MALPTPRRTSSAPPHQGEDVTGQSTTRFRKGASGNPAGRPRGSRNRLGEAFLAALQADFLRHGTATIAALRDKAPATYVNTVAGLLPKEVKLGEERQLSDEEVLERIRQLDAIIAPLLRAQGRRAARRHQGGDDQPGRRRGSALPQGGGAMSIRGNRR